MFPPPSCSPYPYIFRDWDCLPGLRSGRGSDFHSDTVSQQERSTSMSFRLLRCNHRHCVFTIDEELRHFKILHDRWKARPINTTAWPPCGNFYLQSLCKSLRQYLPFLCIWSICRRIPYAFSLDKISENPGFAAFSTLSYYNALVYSFYDSCCFHRYIPSNGEDCPSYHLDAMTC